MSSDGDAGPSKGKQALDYFFVLRPTLWFPIWTMILAGASGKPLVQDRPLAAILEVTGLSLLMGMIYLVNQIRDIETDRINQKLFYFHEGLFSPKEGIAYASGLGITGLILLVSGGNVTLLLLVLTILFVAGLLYSVIPSSWKNHPWGSLVATGVGGALCFLIGRSLVSLPLWEPWLPILGYSSAFLAVGLFTMVPDREGDAAADKRTFVVVYGEKRTLWAGTLLVMAALLLALRTGDMVLLISSGFSLPFFLVAASRREEKAVATAVKLSILSLSMMVGLLYYPTYLALAGIYFVIARVYYRKRFAMTYPTLFGR